MQSKEIPEESKSDQSQHSENEDMLASVVKSSVHGSNKDVSMKSAQSSRRGRPKIPIQWSRIICFDDID